MVVSPGYGHPMQ